jgi:hypothetical protein
MPGGDGIVEGGEIPYQPWALEQRRKNFENRLKVDVQNLQAPPIRGEVLHARGAPRDGMPFPFQIIQSADTILIAYEFGDAERQIHE